MRLTFLLPLAATLAFTTPVRAQGTPYDSCGALVNGVTCTFMFLDDAGCLWFIGGAPGGFQIGDIVRVTGLADTGCITICQQGCGCINQAMVTAPCDTDPTDPFCFCDPVSPCNNASAGTGCANSTGAGAALSGSGSASIAADDLVLTASDLPPSVFGLFFMGTDPHADPFGDGLRCVGGSVFRFPIQQASPAGEISFGPGVATYAQSNFGSGIFPGQNWNFQAWYRDPSGPCGTGFNLSNGARVAFVP